MYLEDRQTLDNNLHVSQSKDNAHMHYFLFRAYY